MIGVEDISVPPKEKRLVKKMGKTCAYVFCITQCTTAYVFLWEERCCLAYKNCI